MPLLSIIIPVYNEAATIAQVLTRVEGARLPDGIAREIIVINDGSTDQTAEILKQFVGRHQIIHTSNTGKGGAVRKGFSLSRGDYVVVQDADLEQDPNDFSNLLVPIIAGDVDAVFGSRFLGAYKPISLIMSLHYISNKLFTHITNFLTGYRTSDVWTGYKMYSRKSLNAVLPHLRSNGIEFELEITILLSKVGMKVKDVPISYVPRWYQEGKKTDWQQAVISLRKLLEFHFRKIS